MRAVLCQFNSPPASDKNISSGPLGLCGCGLAGCGSSCVEGNRLPLDIFRFFDLMGERPGLPAFLGDGVDVECTSSSSRIRSGRVNKPPMSERKAFELDFC